MLLFPTFQNMKHECNTVVSSLLATGGLGCTNRSILDTAVLAIDTKHGQDPWLHRSFEPWYKNLLHQHCTAALAYNKVKQGPSLQFFAQTGRSSCAISPSTSFHQGRTTIFVRIDRMLILRVLTGKKNANR